MRAVLRYTAGACHALNDSTLNHMPYVIEYRTERGWSMHERLHVYPVVQWEVVAVV